jgi:hypothetical protein
LPFYPRFKIAKYASHAIYQLTQIIMPEIKMSLIQSAQILYMFPVCKTKLFLLLHLAHAGKKNKKAKKVQEIERLLPTLPPPQ